RIGIEPNSGNGILRPFGVEADVGEARLRREGRARINDGDLVAGDLYELCQHLADVGGSDDEHAGRRYHGMDEHLALGGLGELALAAIKPRAERGIRKLVVATEELVAAIGKAGTHDEVGPGYAGLRWGCAQGEAPRQFQPSEQTPRRAIVVA